MKWLIAYLATALAFGLLDFLWLRWAAPNLYRPAIGELLAPTFRVAPALLFYLIYIGAIVWFAILPGAAMGFPLNIFGGFHPIQNLSVANSVINGGLFGMVAYCVYDLTNQATMKVWPWQVTAIDIAWGAAATALASGLGALALKSYIDFTA